VETATPTASQTPNFLKIDSATQAANAPIKGDETLTTFLGYFSFTLLNLSTHTPKTPDDLTPFGYI
jgi:hypothetical protein